MSKHRAGPGLDPHKSIPDKQVRAVIQMLIDDGWNFVRYSSANHPVLRWPDSGRQITIPKTPSDRRGLANSLSAARKVSGIDHRPPKHGKGPKS